MVGLQLIGSRFFNISAKRDKDYDGKISLKTNIQNNFMEISKSSDEILEVGYTFSIDYGGLGKISVGGILYLKGDKKIIKKAQESYKKKDVKSKEQIIISNLILQKASIKALQLEDEFGLPPHIRLPTLSIEDK